MGAHFRQLKKWDVADKCYFWLGQIKLEISWTKIPTIQDTTSQKYVDEIYNVIFEKSNLGFKC